MRQRFNDWKQNENDKLLRSELKNIQAWRAEWRFRMTYPVTQHFEHMLCMRCAGAHQYCSLELPQSQLQMNLLTVKQWTKWNVYSRFSNMRVQIIHQLRPTFLLFYFANSMWNLVRLPNESMTSMQNISVLVQMTRESRRGQQTWEIRLETNNPARSSL